MSPERGDRDSPPGTATSVLRDPLVPLDLGGWLRRVTGVLRDNAAMLLGMGAVLGLLGVAFRVAVLIAMPSLDEIGRQLVIAGRDKPGNYVDRWTVFRIGYLPAVPTFVVFVALTAVSHAFCTGAAYYRSLRRANGQPTRLTTALRAAAARVPQAIGWYVLATTGTALTFGALLLPGALISGRWLRIVGGATAMLLVVMAVVVVLPTIYGVVFLERRGLRRCVGLVKGRLRLAAGRTVVAVTFVGLYLAAVGAIMDLLLAPFGGQYTVPLPYGAIEYTVNALLNVPLFGVSIAAMLVTYAELRHREDRSTTTRTLAAEVPL